MIDSSKNKFLNYIDAHSIHVLLVSILVLVFVPPFLAGSTSLTDNFIKFNFLLIVATSFLIVRRIKVSRYLGFITFTLIIADAFLEHDILNYISQIGLSFMIIHAFFLVLKEAMSLRGDAKNMILISITGYLIIGLIGGFLVAGLEFWEAGSYAHTTGMTMDLYNYIYYSFVTMTTLGYGDIVPITEKSQALALMLVLSGQLFLSVIIAINIAKFMQSKKSI